MTLGKESKHKTFDDDDDDDGGGDRDKGEMKVLELCFSWPNPDAVM